MRDEEQPKEHDEEEEKTNQKKNKPTKKNQPKKNKPKNLTYQQRGEGGSRWRGRGDHGGGEGVGSCRGVTRREKKNKC